MSKRLSKRLSNLVPGIRWALSQKPSKTSFSLPKDMRKKKHSLVQRSDGRIIQACNYSKTSTDSDNDWITSDEEVIDSPEDFEDFSFDGKEYSSIEVARSTGICYSSLSTDTLVAKQSVVLDDFCSDSCEFFSYNKPVAVSTPIKRPASAFSRPINEVYSGFDESIPVASSTPKPNRRTKVMKHDESEKFKIFKDFSEENIIKEVEKFKIFRDCSEQERTIKEPMMYLSPEMQSEDVFSVYSNFDEYSPVASSTPKLNRRANVVNLDEIEKFKIFKDFSEENTIKEEPVISYLMSPERKSEDVISDIQDHLQETSISSILIPDISEILKCKDVTKLPNENRPVSAEKIGIEATGKRHAFLETKASNVLEKEPIYRCSSDSEIEKIKSNRKDEEGKNISVCCLTIPPPSKELKKSKPLVKTSKRGKAKDDLFMEKKV